MKFREISEGLRDPELDKTYRKMTDVRKPELSLRLLGRLRRMREVRKMESQKELSTLELQYAPKDQE